MSYFGLDNDFWTFGNGKKMSRIEPLTDIFKMLKYRIEQIDKECERLDAENKQLKSEQYKDVELQKMAGKVAAAEKQVKETYDSMRYGFGISEKQHKDIYNWMKRHDEEMHSNPKGYHGAIGGGFDYVFTPTSIGTVGECRCGTCHSRALNHAFVDGSFNSELYEQYMEEHKGSFAFEDLI